MDAVMRRHWTHWVGAHHRCHPARCERAAIICNIIESGHRAAEAQARSWTALQGINDSMVQLAETALTDGNDDDQPRPLGAK